MMRLAILFGTVFGLAACEVGVRMPSLARAEADFTDGPAAAVFGDDPTAAVVRDDPQAAALRDDPAAAVPRGEPPSGSDRADMRRTSDTRHVGTLVARESVDVPARIEGVIAGVEVRIGDRVTAGDPIAVIDAEPIREQLAIARAAARAAAAQGERARVELVEAESRHQRRLSLADQLAREDIENARFAVERARAVLTEATAADAEHSARVSQLERALTETVVTAPFSGTVSIRYTDAGALVGRGAPIVRLIATTDLWVRFAIPADEKPSYAVDDRIEVFLEPDQQAVAAVIRRIAPDLDPVTQMILAEAELVDELGGRAPALVGTAAWVEAGS
jgi:membrane fusion protein, multidrug efflux system